MRSNFHVVIKNIQTRTSPKPKHKAGGAKQKAWSYKDRNARLLTGRVTIVTPE